MTDQALTLRVTVGNRGAGPSGPTTLTYYRSDDSTITPADTEVGTDGVAGLGASERSGESTLTYAPSTPGAYYYGVCVDSMPGESDTTNNCSAVAAATVSEFDIDNLPWVADGITGDERRVMDHIRDLATIDRSMSQRVAGSPWLSDGVAEDDLWMLADLRDFAESHPEIAVLVTTVPDETGRLIEAVLSSLRWILSSDPGRSEQFLGQIVGMGLLHDPIRDSNLYALASLSRLSRVPDKLSLLTEQPWFADGLDEEEIAFVATLSVASQMSDNWYRSLLQSRNAQSTTISLPLAGDVKLWAFQLAPFPSSDDTLELIEDAVRASEKIMNVPFPTKDVIVLLDTWRGGGTWSEGIVSVTRARHQPTFRMTLYHEIAHHYRLRLNVWFHEGGADFISFFTHVEAGFSLKDLEEDWLSTIPWCANEGLENIQQALDHSDESNSGCHYTLGANFLTQLFKLLGQETMSAALRELYLQPELKGRDLSEEDFYRTFLKHTPSELRGEFRDLYRRLHGGPYADVQE